jgi:hypothetical protein
MSGSLLFYWTFSITSFFNRCIFCPYRCPISWNSNYLSSFCSCSSSLSLHHLIVCYHFYLHTAFLLCSIFDEGLNFKVFWLLTQQIHKQWPFWSMQVHTAMCIVHKLFKLNPICICDTLRTHCWEYYIEELRVLQLIRWMKFIEHPLDFLEVWRHWLVFLI